MRPRLLALLIFVAACGSPATSGSGVVLYPAPLYAATTRAALPVATACLTTDRLKQHATVDARAPDLLRGAGLSPVAPGPDCDFTLAFSGVLPSLTAPEQAAWNATATMAGSDERYVVVAATRKSPAVASAELYAESERGALHALTTALALVDEQRRVHAATIIDAPAIAARGLVEGYYGQPFSRGQRSCLIATMERLRQNLYLYGPKNDVYSQLRWADPYPPDVAADLGAAAAMARARLIDFVWAVSPGSLDPAQAASSISFASDADFARLTHKIDLMRGLGIDRFALFLDDTTPGLVHAADQAMFATPVAAHADLANRLDDYVTGGDPARPHILFVGYVYTSATPGWKDYAQTLGATLHPGIRVMWTGLTTYSRSMQALDLALPNALLGRKVLIWDNEPESAAPLTGRSADLPDGISGLLSNPVLIQLGYGFDDWWRSYGTVADYAWGPAGYDATRSFDTWHLVDAKPPGC